MRVVELVAMLLVGCSQDGGVIDRLTCDSTPSRAERAPWADLGKHCCSDDECDVATWHACVDHECVMPCQPLLYSGSDVWVLDYEPDCAENGGACDGEGWCRR